DDADRDRRTHGASGRSYVDCATRACRGGSRSGCARTNFSCNDRDFAKRTPDVLVSLEVAAEQWTEALRIDRLRDVMIEAGLERSAFVLALPPTGYGDQLHRLAPRLGADTLRHLV